MTNKIKEVARMFNKAGQFASTNEDTKEVNTELETKGINYEIFKVFVEDDKYTIRVERNCSTLGHKEVKTIEEIEEVLRFRIAENQ